MKTTTYTLDEAKHELDKRECAWHGHSWQIIEAEQIGPVRLICDRCGASHKVESSLDEQIEKPDAS